ncbi:anaphase-promoting complex subunit cdc27 [Malassezia furfur]|uniref:Anaphase-promoting complex subunit cdc27 n=1 Tax=Malassezia furfur TaxID=55194 RepID=A0ABY8EVH4_MALFU|nr:anaphase-promoting complex subunit cdc27 [Malassezia furfur]
MRAGPSARPAHALPPGTRARHAQHLAGLAESYLHITDAPSGAVVTAPDWASATLYATHALALDADSVLARRVLATCYMMGGTELVFPFAPSSLSVAPSLAGAAAPTRAGALAAVHLLQRGARATFADVPSARVYATACTVLGRFRDAQEALEWTSAHADVAPSAVAKPRAGRDGTDIYTSQVRTQLGRIAMKQARYSDAAAYFTEARQLDPLNWGAYTGLCDMGMAPTGAEAFPEPAGTPAAASTSAGDAASGSMGPIAASTSTSAAPAGAASVGAAAASGALKRARAAREPTPTEARAADARPMRPVRRVTPRAAALRSGMARTNAVPPPPQDTTVPPVPSVPRRAPSAEARTLSASRNTNQADVGRAASAAASGAPAKPEARRAPVRRAETRPVRGRAPSAVARTDSGLRRVPPRAEAPAEAPVRRAPPRAVPEVRAPSAEASERVRPETDSERYTYALLRDLGEVYRLVRLFRGREAVALLDPAAVPPGSLRAAHRHTASVHCLLGRALHDASEYAQAETHFACAREQEPYLLMHMDIYSLVLFQLHREVALAALAQDLLAVDPRAAVAHIAAGNTWSLQHQHDAAYQCFVQATLVSPECAYAYTLAGYEALELEQPRRAVRLFRCARRCDRRHWNALAGLGQVYLREGQAALASEAYAEAFLINSANPVLLDLLGYALEQAGDAEGALAVYQRAIEMNPKAAMTRLKKAQLLLRTARARGTALSARECAQRRAAAHTELLKVCALAPMEPQVHLLLARSYMRLGGGRFAYDAHAAPDEHTPPSSPGAVHDAQLPQQYASEIAHHLATAIDLDPRCVREVSAMGEGTKLALHAHGNTSIAEDDHEDTQAYDGAFLASDGESIDGDALLLDGTPAVLHYDSSGSADMQASRSFAYEPMVQ